MGMINGVVQPHMTVDALARKVIDVLDYQQNYFRSRDINILQRCKELEGELRHDCKMVLDEHTNGLKLDLQ